ncbi:MAG: HPF/RaiA family ribosome-associated protein [Candidatus Eisenbacteria bacterium]|nr:HPF/RaiA family ribosome-associated protein [Candidatus Latescibacterota bacterium]MBD3301587.1 HPF/RaiA family ribosome-associated protein [Candidatus Eisenbacteria bacterium]
MQVPLELSFRRVDMTDEIEELIRDQAGKLEQVHDSLVSCRVAVERDQKAPKRGNPYRVRLDIRVPPGQEIIVRRESSQGEIHEELTQVIRESFSSARRQLRELNEKQRGDARRESHREVPAEGEPMRGSVSKLFLEERYGFVATPDGEEVYFHENAVVGEPFDDLRIGYGVSFTREEGEKGPQASTVRVIDRPGSTLAGSEEPPPKEE